jgi:hypothetical protein
MIGIIRAGILAEILIVLTAAGCSHKSAEPRVDPAAARKLSDSFMADLLTIARIESWRKWSLNSQPELTVPSLHLS